MTSQVGNHFKEACFTVYLKDGWGRGAGIVGQGGGQGRFVVNCEGRSDWSMIRYSTCLLHMAEAGTLQSESWRLVGPTSVLAHHMLRCYPASLEEVRFY